MPNPENRRHGVYAQKKNEDKLNATLAARAGKRTAKMPDNDKVVKTMAGRYGNADTAKKADSEKKSSEARRNKAMAGRYASGKEAEKRMQEAAKRRTEKDNAAKHRYALKESGGRGNSEWDSPTQRARFQGNQKKAASMNFDRPTGTRKQQIKWRAKHGDFKGKYYGPDEFKGDLKAVEKWRKNGRQRNADGSPKV